jgi:hypothetical protein
MKFSTCKDHILIPNRSQGESSHTRTLGFRLDLCYTTEALSTRAKISGIIFRDFRGVPNFDTFLGRTPRERARTANQQGVSLDFCDGLVELAHVIHTTLSIGTCQDFL